jgi:hypothetical protein
MNIYIARNLNKEALLNFLYAATADADADADAAVLY